MAGPTLDADSQATAEHLGLTMVTRNVRDLGRADVAVVNPCDAAAADCAGRPASSVPARHPVPFVGVAYALGGGPIASRIRTRV
jgi:hypothetical protein